MRVSPRLFYLSLFAQELENEAIHAERERVMRALLAKTRAAVYRSSSITAWFGLPHLDDEDALCSAKEIYFGARHFFRYASRFNLRIATNAGEHWERHVHRPFEMKSDPSFSDYLKCVQTLSLHDYSVWRNSQGQPTDERLYSIAGSRSLGVPARQSFYEGCASFLPCA